MSLAEKIEKLQYKVNKHLETAYNLQYTDPSISDYSEFKAQKALAKIQFLSKISA